MANSPTTEKVIPYALLGMTAVTGLVDAVSFLSLGRVFTANMTGNIVLLAFAVAHAPGVSVVRSLTALVAFFFGATVGGRILIRARTDALFQSALLIFALEIAFLAAAMFAALGHNGVLENASAPLYTIILCTALAMGLRNAAVRKLGVADLTTTVLTLTITGLAATLPWRGAAIPAGSEGLVPSSRCLPARR